VDGETLSPAYVINGYNKAGMQFREDRNNSLPNSEDPEAWTPTGSPTVTNAVDAFGDISLGSIAGVANDRITMASGVTAAGKDFVGSVYAKVASGTLDFYIRVRGSSSPFESVSVLCTATTTLQRFYNPHDYTSFTGSAGGNAEMSIILNGTGTLLVGGMMLENKEKGTSLTNQNWGASSYIMTTSAGVSEGGNLLVYKANKNYNKNKGTVIAWVSGQGSNFLDYGPSEGPTMLGFHGTNGAQWSTVTGSFLGAGNGTLSFWMDNVRKISDAGADLAEGVWYHLAYVYDYTTDPGTISFYVDGVLISTETQSATPNDISNMYIGMSPLRNTAYAFGAPLDAWKGVIDRVTVYGTNLNATAVDADFDSDKASYGK
jgi:hypothetical protein